MLRHVSSLRARVVLSALIVFGVAGCAVGDGSDEGTAAGEAALAGDGWQVLGTGVAYRPASGGSNVVIIYGGYTAQQDWVERWADELDRLKGDALGIGHLYAVQGPNEAGYANHEIQNSHLAAHLGAEGRASGASSVVVIAHSSGTYVADELFKDIKNGLGGVPADTVPKISYFDLDGGGPADAALVHRFAHTFFVWGWDARISRESHNAEGMKALGADYTQTGGAFKVVADGSGCDANTTGGRWCMHDTLINTRPHNPEMYDLKDDYGDFSGDHHLVTSYLDPLDPPPTIASAQSARE
jgi:hypothetical protein